MEPTNSRVVDALQAPLRMERRCFTQIHDEEHAAEYLRYHRLESWFNGFVSDARARRRRLLRQIYAFGGTPDPNVALPQPVSAEYMASLDSPLADTQDLFQSLWDNYQVAVEVCVKAADQDTLKIVTKNQRQVRKSICKVEAKLKKLRVMGVADFLTSEA